MLQFQSLISRENEILGFPVLLKFCYARFGCFIKKKTTIEVPKKSLIFAAFIPFQRVRNLFQDLPRLCLLRHWPDKKLAFARKITILCFDQILGLCTVRLLSFTWSNDGQMTTLFRTYRDMIVDSLVLFSKSFKDQNL